MLDYLEDMKALEVQNRTIALMENGSWGPRAASHMTNFINNNLKNMTLLEPKVTIKSAGKDSDVQNIDALADAIIAVSYTHLDVYKRQLLNRVLYRHICTVS